MLAPSGETSEAEWYTTPLLFPSSNAMLPLRSDVIELYLVKLSPNTILDNVSL